MQSISDGRIIIYIWATSEFVQIFAFSVFRYDSHSGKINYEEGISFSLAGSAAVFLGHKKDYLHSMLYEDIRYAISHFYNEIKEK